MRYIQYVEDPHYCVQLCVAAMTGSTQRIPGLERSYPESLMTGWAYACPIRPCSPWPLRLEYRSYQCALDGRGHVVDEHAPVNSMVYLYVLRNWGPLVSVLVGSLGRLMLDKLPGADLAIEQTLSMRIVSWACISE